MHASEWFFGRLQSILLDGKGQNRAEQLGVQPELTRDGPTDLAGVYSVIENHQTNPVRKLRTPHQPPIIFAQSAKIRPAR